MPSRSLALKIWTATSALLATAASVAADPQPAGAMVSTGEASRDATALALSRIDFAAGTVTPWTVKGIAPRTSTNGALGDDAGEPLALPEAGPPLPVRGSRFSALMRARDLFQLERYPARAVAKLYRLDAKGKRQGTACTAQFVGPRHLLTAAHCLIDRTVGRPHPGFEIALRHDGGRDHGILPVTAGWAPTVETTARPRVIHVEGPIDYAADCHDVALIQVAEPAGERLGWLGMSSGASDERILHRFSYPNESSATTFQRLLDAGDQPETAQAGIRKSIENRRLTEPDFSPDNLYYEYGPPDQVHDEALSERNGAVLPGRSGSALIDGSGNARAIMSRSVLGVNYSCRLTPELIGAFSSIAGRGRAVD